MKIDFSPLMSKNKYKVLHRFFHVSNNDCNKSSDLIYKVRPLIDLCNDLFKRYNTPGKNLSIDETMVKFKGRIKFRQYIKSKPVKYGIKCYLICNSFNGYCYGIIVYTGKGTMKKLKGMSLTETVVTDLISPYINKGRVLYVDNFFNTIPLNNYLWENNTGMIGTMRKNRTKSKNKIKFPKTKKSYNIYMNSDNNNNICLIYINDRKEFIMTTNKSFPQNVQYKSNNQSKIMLDIQKNYNLGAKGVDLCNQQTTKFRYNHSSLKWWKPLCYHLIHIILYNSYILYKNFKQNLTYKQFYREILSKLIGIEFCVKKKKKLHEIKYIDKNKKSEKRLRCKLSGCKNLSMWMCEECSGKKKIASLCIPDCWNKYHSKK